MSFADKARTLLGKALRPLHAGEEKLLLLQREIESPMEMRLHSEAFPLGATIPLRYAGAEVGDNVSPPLEWSHVPAHTRELLLVCEDPDFPGLQPFIHWIARIPPTLTSLPEDLPPARSPYLGPELEGFEQGVNSLKLRGYFGPRPPPGHGPHHYYFQLFALDRQITLPDSADRGALIEQMTGHVLAQGHHIGLFERT